jgi:hypothetical protein
VRQVVSGWKKTANRERIKELISIAASGRYHAVVVYKLDRIGRRLSEVAEYFEQLAENNVLLISVTDSTFDLTNPMQLQFAQSLAIQAQSESGNTSSRVRNDRAVRKAKGAWLGGPAPFGWEPDREFTKFGEPLYNRTENGLQRLRLHKTVSPTLKTIIDWVRVERMSTISAVRRANEEGPRNRQCAELRYAHVRNLLRNPVLFGGVPRSTTTWPRGTPSSGPSGRRSPPTAPLTSSTRR